MAIVELSRVPEPFHRYIEKVEEQSLTEALSRQRFSFRDFVDGIPSEKRDYRYAEGKWTLRDVFQHIIDAERIFAYRALCIARKEKTSLPSFDEDSYAMYAKAAGRDWDEMTREFVLVRESNEILFNSFDEEQLETSGTSSGRPIYVKAIGFIMVGHINHHVKVIQERYL
jgi:hypothetical protein